VNYSLILVDGVFSVYWFVISFLIISAKEQPLKTSTK